MPVEVGLELRGSDPPCYKCARCLTERECDSSKIALSDLDTQVFRLLLGLLLVPHRFLLSNTVTFVLLACECGLLDSSPAPEPLSSTQRGG